MAVLSTATGSAATVETLLFLLEQRDGQIGRLISKVKDDQDVIGEDQLIGASVIDLKETTSLERTWLDLVHANRSGRQARVCVSLELLSQSEAAEKPAGFGREEPNQHPKLSQPARPESGGPGLLDAILGLCKPVLAVCGCSK